MAPNCRSSAGNHYSYVDDWKAEVNENLINEVRSGPDLPKCPRPATCPTYGADAITRPGRTRNCCRTNHDIPFGSHLPVGETLDCGGEWKPAAKPVKHLEYGYEASWRPSRAVVPVKDIMEPCVVTPAEVEFRPSIKVIDPGTGAWSEKWKASKRHIDPGRSKDFLWSPCVKTSHPHKMGHEEQYRPQVRPDLANSTLETTQGHFKPIRRHLIPYTPLRQTAPYRQKRHLIVPTEWVPPFRIQGEDYNKAPPKQNRRARVPEYAASHPPLCIFDWGVSARPRPGTAPSETDRPGSPSAYLGHGATPFACGPNENHGDSWHKFTSCRTLHPSGLDRQLVFKLEAYKIYALSWRFLLGISDWTGLRRNTRKYIPSGHLSHFENKNCCICKVGVGDIERRTLRNQSASGPYHEAVPDRNPIVGHMPETDVLHQPKVSPGPALYGPAGSINSDIIDHKFSGLRQERAPVSEMKDQYRRWENIMQNKP